MLERKIKPIALTVGTVFAAALASAAVAETDSGLFAVDELDRGYDRLADAHGDGDEGSCGEGKCGEGDDAEDDGDEGSCGEGNCGEDDAEDGGDDEAESA